MSGVEEVARSDGWDTWLTGGSLRRASRRSQGAAADPFAAAALPRQYPRVAPGEQLRPRLADHSFQPLASSVLRKAGVRHGFSTRGGGVSTVYLESAQAIDLLPVDSQRAGELNLGFTAADARENVLHNRRRLLEGIFGEVLPLVTLRQIHSPLIHQVTRLHAADAAVLHGDGMITDDPGIVLGIQTADCVPVLLADPKRGAVGVFHAGWRGTLGRIVENGVGAMQLAFGSDPADMVAAVGPSIGPCCYCVGAEVEHQFRSQFADADELFCGASANDASHTGLEAGRSRKLLPHLDLREANRRQLMAAGLPAPSINVPEGCTSCRSDLFFSHRAQHGVTGRMMGVIGLPA